MLMKEGHKIAKILGYTYSVVLGDPSYYERAGYTTASIYGIKPPFEIEDAYFMALHLSNEANLIDGIMKYDKTFLTFFCDLYYNRI